MKKVFDARYKYINSDITFKKRLSSIISLNQEIFIELISKSYKSDPYSLDWWSASASCRNLQNSPLYLRFCILLLLKEEIETNKNLTKIIVDYESEYKAIKDLLKDKSIEIEYKKDSKILRKIRVVLYFCDQLFTKFFQIFFSRVTNTVKSDCLDEVILIDTFAFPESIKKERYYPGLWEALGARQKKIVFFIPTLVYSSISSFYSSFRELRKKKDYFFIKEDYLSIKDIIYACSHCFRINKITFQEVKHEGINFTELVKEEIGLTNGYRIGIENILNYLFIKNLKKNNIKLIHFVDWWEGQALDSGYSIGVHEFYPGTDVIGYQGFIPRRIDRCMSPTRYENESKVAPNYIGIIGRSFKSLMQSHDANTNCLTVPAFRYTHLWSKNYNVESVDNKIIVALPWDIESSLNILSLIHSCNLRHKYEDKIISIKFHPISPLKDWGDKFLKDWDYFVFEELDLYEVFKESSLLITGNSSAALEAIACNVPTIVIEELLNFTSLSIPEAIDESLWKNCSTRDELLDALKYFFNRSEQEKALALDLSLKVRQEYFEPVTQKGIDSLLSLNKFYAE